MTGKTAVRPFNLLLVDDEGAVISAMQRLFSRQNYQIYTAQSGAEGLQCLQERQIDLMILDLKMPHMDGMEVLQRARESYPHVQVIIQTGHGGVSEAVKAVKLGASEFLQKGDPPEILRHRVGRIYEHWLLEQENDQLARQAHPAFCYEPLVGSSPAIVKLKDMIVRVARSETTVLIQGESGTGKELVARAIHHHSDRADKPFVAVDCGAINETVIESELFGHARGSFTGATQATLGLIRAADGGTLFLDEIGELSPAVQVKFLRTLQERVVRPVGSTQSCPVDIRIVAATNRNLLEEVEQGRFREDLYYRLSCVTLMSPPLQARGDDIPLLSQTILDQPQAGKISLTPAAQSALMAYPWPGNVRELENVLHGALVMSGGDSIDVNDLPPQVSGAVSLARQPLSAASSDAPINGTLAAYELVAIKNALREADDNRRVAAQILDIAEATLYRKIKQYQL